jgi:hypothetical protein
VVVDALSRRDTETTMELAAISAPSFAIQAVMKQVLDDKKGEHWRIIDT